MEFPHLSVPRTCPTAGTRKPGGSAPAGPRPTSCPAKPRQEEAGCRHCRRVPGSCSLFIYGGERWQLVWKQGEHLGAPHALDLLRPRPGAWLLAGAGHVPRGGGRALSAPVSPSPPAGVPTRPPAGRAARLRLQQGEGKGSKSPEPGVPAVLDQDGPHAALPHGQGPLQTPQNRLGWKKSLKIKPSRQPDLPSSRLHVFLGTTSILNTSRGGDSTDPPGSPLQCLPTLPRGNSS